MPANNVGFVCFNRAFKGLVKIRDQKTKELWRDNRLEALADLKARVQDAAAI